MGASTWSALAWRNLTDPNMAQNTECIMPALLAQLLPGFSNEFHRCPEKTQESTLCEVFMFSHKPLRLSVWVRPVLNARAILETNDNNDVDYKLSGNTLSTAHPGVDRRQVPNRNSPRQRDRVVKTQATLGSLGRDWRIHDPHPRYWQTFQKTSV